MKETNARTWGQSLVKLVYNLCATLLLVGCHATILPDGPNSRMNNRRWVINGPTSVTSQTCVEYTATLYFANQIATADRSDSIVLDTNNPDASTYASYDDCVSGSSSSTVVMPAGASEVSFYVRSTLDGPIQLSAASPTAGSAQLTVEGVTLSALGQTSATESVQLRNGLALVYQVHQCGTRFMVADWGNHRVLIWNTIPTSSSIPADVVLGQPNWNSGAPNGGGAVSASVMSYPHSVYCAGGRLFVSDSQNHRVLVWNTIPTVSGTPSSFALGQPNLVSSAANRGGSVDANTLNTPTRIYSDGVALYVVDQSNNRVLIWNSLVGTSGQPADVVLGQANKTSNAANRGMTVAADTLDTPTGVWSDGTRLLVIDGANSRVLVWNALPTTDGQAASFAVGQPNLTSRGFAATAGGLNVPEDAVIHAGRLYVADTFNNRVTIWDTVPTTSGVSADRVLGQAAFGQNTFNAGGISASSLFLPRSVAVISGKLWVADTWNNRVLIWSGIPSMDNEAAASVLGQPNLTTTSSNTPPSYIGVIANPTDVSVTNGLVLIGDYTYHRVLGWNGARQSGQAPDFVLGQADGNSIRANRGGSATLGTFNTPNGVHRKGSQIFVADTLNNRVLVWNSIPTADGTPANFVLGQPDGTTTSAGTTASKMNGPNAVFCDGTRLFVSDAQNNRVLFWSPVPTSARPADHVLGQSNFTSGTGASGAARLTTPKGVYSDGTRLFIADQGNNRVLGWLTIPNADGAAADFALGQPNLSASSSNNGGLSATTMALPSAVRISHGRLIVTDTMNNRVLVWREVPTSDATPADHVLGQDDFTSATASPYPQANRFNLPFGMDADDTRAFIADLNLRRVVVVPLPQ